jgi:hypothetical protein
VYGYIVGRVVEMLVFYGGGVREGRERIRLKREKALYIDISINIEK